MTFDTNTDSKENQMDELNALKAKKRRKSAKKRCEVKKVKGGRFMLLCPHKRPKFISEARAKAYRRR